MLANRVQETTTSTGTGNITLAGAVTNYRTFNAAFGTGRRLHYYIVDDTNNTWEYGIGTLTDSTTLARQTVIESSNANAAVNLGAGTKDVFCSAPPGIRADDVSALGGEAYIKSSHWTRESALAYALEPNRIHYVPFVLDRPILCDGLAVEVTTAQASSQCHLALYQMDENADPTKRLASAPAIDTTTTGLKVGTFTPFFLPPGLYWLAHWSDAAIGLMACASYEWAAGIQIASDTAGPERDITMRFISSQTGLSALPDPATTPNSNNTTVGPVIGLLRCT